jgi:iduronate 2-sulfatase
VYPNAVTLPQYFMQHGYRAESVGKVYHVGHGNYDDAPSWSVPSFKDRVVEYLLPESTDGGKLTREEAYFGNIKTSGPHFELTRGAAWEKVDVPDNAYADGRVATEGIRRLQEAKRSPQPFFLAVGFARPHLPFTVPKKYWDLYDPAKLPLAQNPKPPVNAPPYALKRLGELDQYAPVPTRPPLAEHLQRTLIHGYYAGVSYVDAQMGRVLDELDRLGLAENTIVLLWGDNGYSLGTHGDWTKHTNYEETNRIPYIFAGPGVVRGASTNALIETVDIYPTLCALAGLPAPNGPQPIEGISQVSVLHDPKVAVKDYVYHAFPRPRPDKGGEWLGRAIRTERYRYVEWRPFGRSDEKSDVELYDYTTDPLETENLAPRHPDLCAQFQQLLDRQPAAAAPLPAVPKPQE